MNGKYKVLGIVLSVAVVLGGCSSDDITANELESAKKTETEESVAETEEPTAETVNSDENNDKAESEDANQADSHDSEENKIENIQQKEEAAEEKTVAEETVQKEPVQTESTDTIEATVNKETASSEKETAKNNASSEKEAVNETATPEKESPEPDAVSAATPLVPRVEIIALYAKEEYIVIQNSEPDDIDMTGWSIYSMEGEESFDFPKGYILKAGARIKVGGYGVRDSVDLIWEVDGSEGVWLDDADDPAELYDSRGRVVTMY